MVQVPLPDDSELPDEIRTALASIPPFNVFRMIANTPASFRGFTDLASSILLRSQFDPRKREIAVLRTAHATKSLYEWTQHVRIARNLGVTDAEIEAVQAGGPVTALDEEGNMICRVADEIARDVRLSDEALQWALDRYGVRQACELILCCSYFNMLSRFLESTRVQLEDADLVGGATPGQIAKDAP
jgi:alkylhydroperoxidase family enzyme